MHRCPDNAGHNCVHANAAPRVFDRECLGDRVDPVLLVEGVDRRIIDRDGPEPFPRTIIESWWL
jgi:hypothetical protein